MILNLIRDTFAPQENEGNKVALDVTETPPPTLDELLTIRSIDRRASGLVCEGECS